MERQDEVEARDSGSSAVVAGGAVVLEIERCILGDEGGCWIVELVDAFRIVDMEVRSSVGLFVWMLSEIALDRNEPAPEIGNDCCCLSS